MSRRLIARLGRLRGDARALLILAQATLFTGVPLLLYLINDAPRRSVLKEAISVLTLLAMSWVLGQFFVARGNDALTGRLRAPSWQQIHKVAGYAAIGALLLHPVLIVLPRAFEGGVRPWDAFVTMISTLDNPGLVLGLAAWGMMAALGVTAWARIRLSRHFSTRYRGWRKLHGVLACGFVAAALWHAIALGRHTDLAFSLFLSGTSLAGAALLIRQYRADDAPRKPKGA